MIDISALPSIIDELKSKTISLSKELQDAANLIREYCREDKRPYCGIDAVHLPSDIGPETSELQPGDVISFPALKNMRILAQKVSPNSSYSIFYVQAIKNGHPANIKINDIRYRPRTNENCISSFQQKLLKLNLPDALKELSEKEISCVYLSIDLLPVFDEKGVPKYKCTRFVDGHPIMQHVYKPKFVPFITKS